MNIPQEKGFYRNYAKRGFDVWYVDHLSQLVDVQVILCTIKKVLVREGINEAGQATMEAFNGTN